MDPRNLRVSRAVRLVLGLSAAWWPVCTCGAADKQALPPLQEIQRAVWRHFGSLPDYQPADIIARSDVASLFMRLEKMGWSVPDPKSLLEKVPADDDFLVKQLRGRPGRKLMRKISAYPGAYDRLDRFSQLPRGRRMIQGLVRRTNGDVVLHNMLYGSKGKKATQIVTRNPKWEKMKKPTDRIYTVEMLLGHLQQRYATTKQGGVPAARSQRIGN